MSDLLRPDPPVSVRERLGALLSVVSPARVAAAGGALLLLAVGTWWLLRAPAPPIEAALPVASTAAVAAPDPASSGPARAVGEIVVQAAGAVARPGVYRLESGARTVDLLDAAGGAAPEADVDALALAARLVDGQRVYVPRVGEVVAPAAGPPSPQAPLDLNAATVEQLDDLAGVGPATAAAIVEHRARNGPFRSVDDLLEVRGIGPAKLDGFRDQVRV